MESIREKFEKDLLQQEKVPEETKNIILKPLKVWEHENGCIIYTHINVRSEFVQMHVDTAKKEINVIYTSYEF